MTTVARRPPLFVSLHAIQRYQQRVENVIDHEAIMRLRTMMEPHRTLPKGHYIIESNRHGPPCQAKVIVKDEETVIVTVFPTSDHQVTRALADRNWRVA